VFVRKENKMKKETYSFKARYQDVDFKRIAEENPLYDFVKVEWPWESGGNSSSLVIVSPAGIARMKAVGLCTPRSFSGVKLSASGSGWRHDPVGHEVKDEKIYVIEDGSGFEKLYAQLRERECRKRQIKVTAIR
jgi:hypothetical protein